MIGWRHVMVAGAQWRRWELSYRLIKVITPSLFSQKVEAVLKKLINNVVESVEKKKDKKEPKVIVRMYNKCNKNA